MDSIVAPWGSGIEERPRVLTREEREGIYREKRARKEERREVRRKGLREGEMGSEGGGDGGGGREGDVGGSGGREEGYGKGKRVHIGMEASICLALHTICIMSIWLGIHSIGSLY